MLGEAAVRAGAPAAGLPATALAARLAAGGATLPAGLAEEELLFELPPSRARVAKPPPATPVLIRNRRRPRSRRRSAAQYVLLRHGRRLPKLSECRILGSDANRAPSRDENI